MKELSINEIQQVNAGNLPQFISKIIVMGFCAYGLPLLSTVAIGAFMEEAVGVDSDSHANLMPLYLGTGAFVGLTFGIYLTDSF